MEKPQKIEKKKKYCWGVHQLQRQRYIRARAKYVKNLIEVNPTMELSLFLLQDELKDSLDLQRELFKKLEIANKESNIYKTTDRKIAIKSVPPVVAFPKRQRLITEPLIMPPKILMSRVSDVIE